MTNTRHSDRGRTELVPLANALVVFLSTTLSVGAGAPVTAQSPEGQPAPTAQAAGREDQPTPIFKSAVDLVTVDVSVVDENNRPVRGLSADDFELKVDGEPRRIVSAQFIEQHSGSGPTPSTQYSTNEGMEGGRLVMLVVDQGNIRPGTSGMFLRSADALLNDLGPGDRIAVSVIPGGRMIEFTRHLTIVRQTLRQTVGSADQLVTKAMRQRVGVADALAYQRGDSTVVREVEERECSHLFNPAERQFCIAEVINEMDQLAADVRRRTTNTLTVLRQILGDLARIEGPKTLVLLTEGLYVDREYGILSTIGAAAAQARASMYAVALDDAHADFDVSSASVSPTAGADRELRLAGISALVGYTRGATFTVSANAATAYERLAREMTGYYLVAFEPLPEERDGKSHDIAVRVGRRKVEVRSRREFAMAKEEGPRPSTDELLAETLRAPLPATELPLRVATYNFPDPTSGKVRVLMSAGLGRVAEGAPVTAVAYRVTDDKGKFVLGYRYDVEPPTDDDHRWNGTVSLNPGTYTLKLASLDADGRRASVEHQFDAKLAQAGELVVGDLMLSESVGQADLRPEIEPMVGDAMLESYMEMASGNAGLLKATRVTIEVAVDANAPALLKADADVGSGRDADRVIGVATLALGALPAGEYVARAVVEANGKPVARVTRAFAYVPSSAAIAASGPVALATLSARFDQSHVLAPAVAEHFLSPFVSGADAATAKRLEAAARGDYVAVGVGSGGSALPGVEALLRGLSLYAEGEIELAAHAFRQALAEDGEMAAAAFYLGACYASGGKPKEAAAAWQTTLAIDDQPAFVYTLAAEAFMRARDWQAALDLSDEAVELWPSDDDLQRLHVRSMAFAGKRAEALKAIDGFLEKHADDHEIMLLAMKLLYDANADAQPVVGPLEDRRTYEGYLARYRAANGPEQALAERWLQAFPTTESRK